MCCTPIYFPKYAQAASFVQEKARGTHSTLIVKLKHIFTLLCAFQFLDFLTFGSPVLICEKLQIEVCFKKTFLKFKTIQNVSPSTERVSYHREYIFLIVCHQSGSCR